MVEMLNEKDRWSESTDDAAAVVFKEVLGHWSGYARGLGHYVIPKEGASSKISIADYQSLAEENEKNKNNTEE